jgi:hypothetical protein
MVMQTYSGHALNSEQKLGITNSSEVEISLVGLDVCVYVDNAEQTVTATHMREPYIA